MNFLRALALSLLVCSAAFAQTAALMPVPKLQFFDANGYPLAGGLIYACFAGSSCPGTPQATYTDATAGTANANPVVLDAGGFAAIWLSSSTYKIVVENSAGVVVSTTDNVSNALAANGSLSAALAASSGAGLVGYKAPGSTLTRTIAARLADKVNASDFPGADAGAQITAAIAALPASGGVIDARMLTGTLAAAATLTLNKPVEVLFGAATITFSGNPGINVTAKGASLVGLAHVVSGQTANVGPTVLKSGVVAPLVYNNTSGADGLTLRDLELHCNALGTFGVDVPRTGPSTVTLDGLNVHGCTSAGISVLSGLNDIRRSYVWGNGEGIQFGSDGSIDQYTEVATNTGVGIHVLYGGSRIRAMADYNGSYGIYLDARANSNSNTQVSDCYVDDNAVDNIRIEGQSSGNRNAQYNHVSNCYIAQAAVVGVAADAVRVLNASGTVLSDNVFLGAGLSGATVLDAGGYLIQNSDNTKIDGLDTFFSTQNAISVISGNDTRILGLHARDTAIASTATTASYALSIDAASNRTYVYDSDATDDRSPGYSRGVNNLGNSTMLFGWSDFTPLASPDAYGAGALLQVGTSGQITLNPASGQSVTLGGTVQVGTAAGSTVAQVQTLTGSVGCTTAATAGSACVGTTQTFGTAFADANYHLSCILVSPSTGLPLLSAFSKTASGFTIEIGAGSAAAASGNYDCTAIHQ